MDAPLASPSQAAGAEGNQPMGGPLDAELYEGLVVSSSAAPDTYLQHKVNELEERLKEQGAHVRGLTAQLEASTSQLAQVTAERDTLLRNISCLYLTAKEEMSRRQADLNSLRAELAQLKQLLPADHPKHQSKLAVPTFIRPDELPSSQRTRQDELQPPRTAAGAGARYGRDAEPAARQQYPGAAKRQRGDRLDT